MSIYDQITIIDTTITEDTADTFLSRNLMTTLTNEAIDSKNALKDAEQKKWILEVVEAELIKTAKEGKYSVNIIVPAEYDFISCQQFLINAGYTIKSTSNSRSLFVSWAPTTE